MQRVSRGAKGLLSLAQLGWAEVAWAQSQEPTPVEVVVDNRGEPGPLDESRGELSTNPNIAVTRGALGLQSFLNGQASLAVTGGNAGLGGAPNKLNFAARGINPRFSSRTQRTWDGMPLAIAPYGRPQLTMFPVAMSWMSEIAVDPHGAGPLRGPHSIGGHLRLSLHDIAPGHREVAQLVGEHFGQVSANALVQMADERQQWAIGYTTMQGSGYREHSRLNAHGAFARWRRRLGPNHRLSILGFGYGENTEIPGGLTPAQFAQDPRVSLRPLDRFTGARVGGGVFWDVILSPGLSLRTKAVGGYTDRRSVVSTEALPGALQAPLRVSPRNFGYLQFETRLRADFGALGSGSPKKSWLPSVELGLSPTTERARLRSQNRDPQSGQVIKQRSDDRESIAAWAIFGRFSLRSPNQRWQASAGLRGEWVTLSREDQTNTQLGQQRLFALLPSVDLRAKLLPSLSLIASYGQTFSPPQFLQIALAQEHKQLSPERGHSAQLGLFWAIPEAGLHAQATGFYKGIRHYADVSAERLDQPGNLRAFGVESQLSGRWRLHAAKGAGLDTQLGHTWTSGRIVDGAFDRVRLPWVPAHRLRVGAGLIWPSIAGLFVRSGLAHDGAYTSDYLPELREDPTGRRGQVPAWTTWWASLGAGSLALGPHWKAALSFTAHNLLNQLQYTRTPDRNAGRILQPPRTFRVTLRVEHKKSRPR